jgi:RHS repeat-associated protein
MAGISDKALKSQYAENKYRFNKGSELQNKEFADGSGLEQYDVTYRTYDHQLGRFLQIDPMAEDQENISSFAFASDNPSLLNDSLGLLSDSSHPVVLPTVTVSPQKGNVSPITQFGITENIGIGGTIPLSPSGYGIGTSPIPIILPAIWARVKVGELARKAEAKRWHMTYIKRGPKGQIYVGRCSGY